MFKDNGDGTITDTATGLMWQKDIAPGVYDWEEAIKYCENLDLAEYRNWRLPNVHELQSIVDYGKRAPAINPAFRITLSGHWFGYWSSSAHVGYPGYPWYVDFNEGYTGSIPGLNHLYVRAVRGEEANP